jgi:flagellar protein FlgJ
MNRTGGRAAQKKTFSGNAWERSILSFWIKKNIEDIMNIPDTTVQTTDIKPWDTGHSQKQLKSACQEFEAFFINALLKSADKARSGLFDDKKNSDMYSSMRNMEFAKSISQGGGMGLGNILFQQLQSSK